MADRAPIIVRRCTQCDGTWTDEDLKAKGAVACCPDRPWTVPIDWEATAQARQEALDEMDALFALRYAADQRAIKLWQAEDPTSRELLWPDHADMVVWLLEKLMNPPKHVYWGAGEKDCPKDIKAPNGELHMLRCKRCGRNNPLMPICLGLNNA